MRSSNAVFLGNARHEFRAHYDNSSKMQGTAGERVNDADAGRRLRTTYMRKHRPGVHKVGLAYRCSSLD